MIRADAPSPKPNSRVAPLTFQLVAVTVCLLANGTAYKIAANDHGWGALWIALVGGPILNGILALAGGLATLALPKGRRVGAVCIAVGVPVVAALALLVAVLQLDLHGC